MLVLVRETKRVGEPVVIGPDLCIWSANALSTCSLPLVESAVFHKLSQHGTSLEGLVL